jgi:hypothetical protein
MVTTATLTETPTGCSVWWVVNSSAPGPSGEVGRPEFDRAVPIRVDARHGNRILRVAAHPLVLAEVLATRTPSRSGSYRRLRTVLRVDGGRGIDTKRIIEIG